MSKATIKYLILSITDISNGAIDIDEINLTAENNVELHEQLIDKLEKYQTVSNKIILTEEAAQQLSPVLNNFINNKGIYVKRFVTHTEIKYLANYIATVFGYNTYLTYKRKTRQKDIVVARQLFFTLLYYDKYGTLKSIGNALGFNLDHATVLHAVKAIENLVNTKDKRYYDRLWQVMTTFNFAHKFII